MIESLEARIAPAGIVSIVVRGGDVFLTGDPGDHTFTISGSTGGGLVITPADGLLLKMGGAAPTDAPVTVDTFVRDLKISLRAGQDAVTLRDLHTVRDVSVSLGGGVGDNKFFLQNSDILGSLQILGSGSNNTITIGEETGITAIGRDFSMSFSRGFNDTQISGGLQIGGNFSYRGSADQDGLSLNVSTFRVLGNVDVRTGIGFGIVEFNTDSTAIFGSTTVVSSGRVDTGSSIQFTNSFASEFGQAVTVIGNSGDDVVTFNGEQFHFNKGLSTRLGAGSDAFDLSAGRASIDGNLVLSSTAALSASIDALADLTISGDVLVSGGSDGTTVNIHAAGVIAGKVGFAGATSGTLSMSGDNTAGRLFLAGGISWATPASAADSSISLYNATLGGRSQINMSHGIAGVGFYGVSIEGPVSIKTGNISDGIDLMPLGAEPLVVLAPIDISLGGDNDLVNLGIEGSGGIFNAPLTLNGGPGQDTLDYLTHGNVFNVPPVIRGFETIL